MSNINLHPTPSVGRLPTDAERANMRATLLTRKLPKVTQADNTTTPVDLSRDEYNLVLADITSGNLVVNCPGSPVLGDIVEVEDAALQVGTSGYSLTVNGNGKVIDNVASLVLSTVDQNGVVLVLRYNGTLWKVI